MHETCLKILHVYNALANHSRPYMHTCIKYASGVKVEFVYKNPIVLKTKQQLPAQ